MHFTMNLLRKQQRLSSLVAVSEWVTRSHCMPLVWDVDDHFIGSPVSLLSPVSHKKLWSSLLSLGQIIGHLFQLVNT